MMRSFTQDGLARDSKGHGSPQLDRWADGGAYPSGDAAEVSCQQPDPGDVRLAVLARAIEHEIIPRLMLAHRASNTCMTLIGTGHDSLSPADVQEFAKLVLSPDEDMANACIDAMRRRGISIEAIYLDLLAPVARYLGELWEQDLADFTEVTIGLGRLQQVLRDLSPAFGRSIDHPANGRRVLLLPCPGEQHTFGLVMVAEFFRRAGWDVAGGPWEAGVDPVVMVRQEWFDVVGFSVASNIHLDELGQCIRSVRNAALNPQIGIMAGGPIFAAFPDSAAHIAADAVTSDGRQAPGLAEGLVAAMDDRRRSARTEI